MYIFSTELLNACIRFNMKSFPSVISVLFLIITVSAASTVLIYEHFFTPSICFARSGYLASDLQGAREARSKFKDTKQGWQREMATLRYNFQSSTNGYNIKLATLSVQLKKNWEKQLSAQRQQLEEYARAVELMTTEEDNGFVNECAL